MTDFVISPGTLTLDDLRALAPGGTSVGLDDACWPGVVAAWETVRERAFGEDMIYGINTGFGSLAGTRISAQDIVELQHRLVRSHTAGSGSLLPDPVVRLILVLKINGLARGHSGVGRQLIESLLALLNADVLPCVRSRGSVGASGDLIPLAHVAAVLIGEGRVRVEGKILPASEGLERAGIAPLVLGPKEGLAMINGTQVSTALAAVGLFAVESLFAAAIVAGAMSVDAALGADVPFSPRIQEVGGHAGQRAVAGMIYDLLRDSEIRVSHAAGGHRVQDTYSLRCQPQVMGACLDLINFAAGGIGDEANAVSDNPLVFPETGEILSGGNFHAEPVALAADILALALSEIGTLSERRVAMLTNAAMSDLPAFLVAEPGLNSGFMAAHIAAASLASENKSLAHPASIDNIPTAADQEDHVSMATFAARRLADMAENARTIVAIELLAAAQGIDFRAPLLTSPRLREAWEAIRARSPFLSADRSLEFDIEAVSRLIAEGWFRPLIITAGA